MPESFIDEFQKHRTDPDYFEKKANEEDRKGNLLEASHYLRLAIIAIINRREEENKEFMTKMDDIVDNISKQIDKLEAIISMNKEE